MHFLQETLSKGQRGLRLFKGIPETVVGSRQKIAGSFVRLISPSALGVIVQGP